MSFRCGFWRLLIVSVLLVATARNILFVLNYSDTLSCYNLQIDSEHYDAVAQKIVEQRGLHFSSPQSVVFPPGLPIFLAAHYALFGHRLVMPKLSFCVLLMLIGFGVWLLGFLMEREPAGMLGATLVVFSPMFRAFAATIQYEVLVAFSILLSLLLVFFAIRLERPVYSCMLLSVAGLSLGYATLAREAVAVLMPVFLLGYLLHSRDGLRRRLLTSLAFSAFFALPGTLWVARYWVDTGGNLIQTRGSIVFEIGNNPNANGTFYLQRTGIASPKGWAFLTSQPRSAIWLAGRKILYFCGVLKDPWNVPRRSALYISQLFFNSIPLNWPLALARGGFLALLCLLGMATVLLKGPKLPGIWMLPASILVMALLHVFYFSGHRYTLPILPTALFLASVPLIEAARFIGTVSASKRRLMLLVALPAVLWAAIALASAPSGVLRMEAEELDGFQVEDRREESASGEEARFASAENGVRQAAFMTEEWIPQGFFRIDLRGRTDKATSGDVLEVVVPVDLFGYGNGGQSIRQRVAAEDLGEGSKNGKVSLFGYLTEPRIIRLEVWTLAQADVWIDKIDFHFGLKADQADGAFALSSAASESEVRIDFGSSEQPGIWIADGWSGAEESQQVSFQWAVGTTSSVLFPMERTVPTELTELSFRARPFPGGPGLHQQVELFLNSEEIGTLYLNEGWETHSLEVLSSAFRNGVNVLTFRHAWSISPAREGIGSDRRPLAAAYDELVIRPK